MSFKLYLNCLMDCITNICPLWNHLQFESFIPKQKSLYYFIPIYKFFERAKFLQRNDWENIGRSSRSQINGIIDFFFQKKKGQWINQVRRISLCLWLLVILCMYFIFLNTRIFKKDWKIMKNMKILDQINMKIFINMENIKIMDQINCRNCINSSKLIVKFSRLHDNFHI